MKKYFSIAVLLIVMLFCTNMPVSAAPEWVTMDDTAKKIYQVDKQTINYSGEDADKTVEIWIKVITKDQADSYGLVHVYIKENMMYMEKENGKYSADGTTLSSTESSSKGWGPLLPNSPAGRIAKQLFVDYRANNKPIATTQITVDPQELQKALNDKIKHGVGNGQTKYFYVRDTCTERGVHTTFDFWLLNDANNNKTYRLNFSTLTGVPGRHTINVGVIVGVDGREWKLSSPQPPGVTSFPDQQNFEYSFNLPYSLVQAIMETKNGITVKWRYDSSDWGYIIPASIVHNMSIMYAGCK
jgi:hypothetical protein